MYQTFNNQQSGSYAGANSREWWMRMLGTAGVTAAGFVGVSAFLNRETREGALPPFERDFLNKTFQYTGAGVAIIAGSAVLLHKNGVSLRMMSMNPWAFAGISLVGGIGSMMTLFACSPESTGIKRACPAVLSTVLGPDSSVAHDSPFVQISLGQLSTASKRSPCRHSCSFSPLSWPALVFT